MKLWILAVTAVLPVLSVLGHWDHRVFCTVPLLGIVVLTILMARRRRTNAKGTSVTKSMQTNRSTEQSGRKGPGPTLHNSCCWAGLSSCPQEPFRAGASQRCQSIPSEDPSGGAEPLLSCSRTSPTRRSKLSWLRSRGKGRHRSRLHRKAASGRSLPWERQGGTWGPAASSELLGNPPSTDSMEDLSRSLMQSLDTTKICLGLLAKMEKNNGSGAGEARGGWRSEHSVCVRCRRCLDDSCPHHSGSAATTAMGTVTASLCSLGVVVRVEEVQLHVGLRFELSVGGKTLHTWEKTVRLPKRCGSEEYCEECGEPLSRSPEDWGTQQGGSHPNTASQWPLPPWAQPVPPDASEWLQRAGMEPLPQVECRVPGHCSTGQCLLCFRCRVKSGGKNPQIAGTAEGSREISI
ncbi:uncharacterized protein LOC110396429 isoform X1 [Numida meleagris]|uniref:uncharacterized protein LOC110396429 isoform X1 n=2 Tax=Numida meleagris TaxID=8996 RepID=UPI000B3DBF52|nr:uncharacterized protein LOC110396429 isoform X1 [Numida meleagris]